MNVLEQIIEIVNTAEVTFETIGQIVEELCDSAIDYGIVLARDPDIEQRQSEATAHQYEVNLNKLYRAIHLYRPTQKE